MGATRAKSTGIGALRLKRYAGARDQAHERASVQTPLTIHEPVTLQVFRRVFATRNWAPGSRKQAAPMRSVMVTRPHVRHLMTDSPSAASSKTDAEARRQTRGGSRIGRAVLASALHRSASHLQASAL